jgi:hypothetical protein
MAALEAADAAAHRGARRDDDSRDEYADWRLATNWMRLAAIEQQVGCGPAVLPAQPVKWRPQLRPGA